MLDQANFKPELTFAQAVEAGRLLESKAAGIILTDTEEETLHNLLSIATADAPKDNPITPFFDESKTPEHNKQIAEVAFQQITADFLRFVQKIGEPVLKEALALLPSMILAAVKKQN